MNFNIAKFCSSSIAVIISYYLNSKFNFGKDNDFSISFYMSVIKEANVYVQGGALGQVGYIGSFSAR